MTCYKIKNWSQFQHFKDRRPPWIKLHRDILDNLDINMISDCAFRVLAGLWLLASEDKTMTGTLPDIDTIAFRLRLDKSKIINALTELKPFIIQSDISAISGRYQVDVPETETETETETEREQSAPALDIISESVKAIKLARPEFAKLREMDLQVEISACPPELRSKTIAEFLRDATNSIEPPRNPLGMLRGYIRKAVPAQTPASGLTFCKVCNFDTAHCKCGKADRS